MAMAVLSSRALASAIIAYQHGCSPREAIARASAFRKRGSFYVPPGSSRHYGCDALCLPPGPNFDPRFPLHWAILRGHAPLVAYIVDYHRPMASAEAIDCAFVTGRVAIVHHLLEQRARVAELRTCFEPIDATAAAPATETSWNLPSRIVRHDDPTLYALLATYSQRGWSHEALTLAIQTHKMRSFECFVANLVDVAAKHGDLGLTMRLYADGVGATPRALAEAAARGHLEIVTFLTRQCPKTISSEALERALSNLRTDVALHLLACCPNLVCSMASVTTILVQGCIDLVAGLIAHRPIRPAAFVIARLFALRRLDVLLALAAARCIEWTPSMVALVVRQNADDELLSLVAACPEMRWSVCVSALLSFSPSVARRCFEDSDFAYDDAFDHASVLSLMRLLPEIAWWNPDVWYDVALQTTKRDEVGAYLLALSTGRVSSETVDLTYGGVTTMSFGDALWLDLPTLLTALRRAYPALLDEHFLDCIAASRNWLHPDVLRKLVRWWCHQYTGRAYDDILSTRGLAFVCA
ncbi:hypothetical protein SPRG_02705 [Saprolegnia parasitica CBS 223.65]|uniref:Uncharacterized protein n=1 Tax=Saprolegnia parasitica (strain CBS 223.65) TaxID=695850 RepID=A0A067CZM4_SAPPC|nr:hypothetical protein SPRG_02705 [Saprolegnia parasitica CBS 223.65]KDO32227.1 hypothetical protein SPRG_02705 [Saprolegnia parasitica CBS 223.65]|eukprot:XP_012196685.1 hypothetical protein SPRG_02705 [Saprolegnia parasitica CBS 223.65]